MADDLSFGDRLRALFSGVSVPANPYSDEAFQAAAARTKQSVKPEGGRKEGDSSTEERMANVLRMPNEMARGITNAISPPQYAPGQSMSDWHPADEREATKAAFSTAGGTLAPGLATGEPVGLGEVLFGAGVRGKPPVRSTDLPDLRKMPVDEAVKVAKLDPHLIKAGDQSEGYYVGGPRDINSKRGMTNLRKDFDAYVAADPRGGDWYDRYRSFVNEVNGGDPVRNKWMSNQEAQWSAGVSPESEIQFALKENNASIAGMPVKSARPAQHNAHMAAVEAKNPDLYQLGDKTGAYARLVNPDQFIPPGATGVNDFRHARNFRYTEAQGGAQRDALTAAQHRFLDYETANAVRRANETSLGGRSNWTGEQLQAAPWVRQKALDIMDQRPGLSYEEAFAEANKTIADFADKHTAFAPHEAMPGSETGHMPESIAAGPEMRAAYSADPRSSWANAPMGRDAIYSDMQMPGTGVAMRVRPTTEMQGMYTAPSGVVETNPGATARPLVAFDSGKVKTVAPADQTLLNAGEAVRGYIDAQNAAAWHKPWLGGQKGQSNSLFIPMEGKASAGQLHDLLAQGNKYGLPDVVDTGKGVTMTRFNTPPADISAALKKWGLLDTLEGIGGSTPMRAKVDSGYIDYAPKWKEGVGSGAATREMLDHINKTPQLREVLNNSELIPKNALARLERDEEWAKQFGAPREDIQNARRIISQGKGWVDRIESALKSKAILPATAAAIFAAASQAQNERQ